jgi:MFS family permease
LLSAPFLLCAAANFLQALAFNLYVHFPGFLKQLGAGEVRIGFIFGVTAAVAILVRPPIGRAMDALGRRRMILAGGLLNVVVCLLYRRLTDLGPAVYVVRSLHGVAEAVLFTAFFAHAADLIPASRRTEGIALYGVSGMLPISLGGLLGDVILARADFGALFATAMLLAAGSLLLSIPLRDVSPGAHELPHRGFFAALAQRDLLPVWFMGTVFAMALAAHFTFLKTFVMATGIGSVGSFFTAYSAAAILLRLALAWLPERVGPKRVLLPALASLALGLVGLATARAAVQVVAAGVLCGLGHGFTFPILSGLVVARARAAERGAALSIFTALFDAGVLLGGPAHGAVIGLAGYAGMFATAAALVVAAAIVFAVWDRHRPDRPVPAPPVLAPVP